MEEQEDTSKKAVKVVNVGKPDEGMTHKAITGESVDVLIIDEVPGATEVIRVGEPEDESDEDTEQPK